MLCLPGLTPVAKLAQATGDSDGCVVSSFANVPCSDSRLRFGSLPSSIHLRARVGSMPSKPRTNTRCFARRRGLPEDDGPQPVRATEATRTAQTRGLESIRRL